MHEYFKALVRDRRGDKLKAPRKQIFSGEFWLGEKARSMGLIDAVGDIRGVLRDRYGEDVKLRLITGPKRWLPSLAPGFPRGGSEERMASSLVDHALMAAEERLYWSRFGL